MSLSGNTSFLTEDKAGADGAKVIRITGPESSGKTTLARALAAELNGVYVAEAAREYLNARGGVYTEADLPLIWQAQSAAEDAARSSGAQYIVCDTGPEVIYVWAEVKYGRVPPQVARAVVERRYDMTLLCKPDLPWAPDPLREAPDLAQRAALFQRYAELLPGATIISGEDRLRQGRSSARL
ncbi:MAG: ATP-binding protein [Bacteroidota bacterium]